MRAENYYELLQVSENADQEIIQAAYRRLVLRYHPDRSSEPNAAEMTQRLNDAYAILSDPAKRAEYDRELRGQASRPSSGTGQSRPNPPPPPRPPPPRPPHAEEDADSNDRFSGNVKWVAFALAGYVLETTDGGKELVDALVSIARGVMPDVAGQEGSRPRKDQQVRPADQLKAIEMLLDRGFGRSPQQLDIAHSVSDRPLAHLSDETLRLLVESAEQLKEGSGVVVDGAGKVVTE